MESSWIQLTNPASEPLTLALAKVHLAIGHTDDDALITKDIKAARILAEKHTNRIFGSRSFLVQYTCWPKNGCIHLPIEPATAITQMRYKDTDGVTQIVASSNYKTWLNHSPPLLKMVTGYTFPTFSIDEPAPLEIEFVAGESTTEELEMLCKAIELTLEYWRQFPGGEESLPHLARGLPSGAIRLLDNLWTGAL